MPMTDDIKKTPQGERIAKVLARAGVASRRGVEAMIADGRVTLNGTPLTTPAVTVGPQDRITVDGKPVGPAGRARLFRYHKPSGLVTTERDEKGRETVFDALPDDLPRLMSVGRLDLNSEGLLLLTNDGGLKRALELPSTGWLRKYRVRVHGSPSDADLEPLRKGVTIDGEKFRGMDVQVDRQQGSNAWLTVGLREGRNREIRRAFEVIGLSVNRLLRVSYGPFSLGELKRGAVEEVRARVMKEQLGALMPDQPDPEAATGTAKPKAKGKRPPTRGSVGPGGKSDGQAGKSGAPAGKARRPASNPGASMRKPGAAARTPTKRGKR